MSSFVGIGCVRAASPQHMVCFFVSPDKVSIPIVLGRLTCLFVLLVKHSSAIVAFAHPPADI